MKRLISYILIICLTMTFLCSCDNSADVKNTGETTSAEVGKKEVASKVEIDSIMFQSFENLLVDVHNAEPYYSSEAWMDKDGNILYPYESNKDLMSGIKNILASLYMPEKVLENATSKELLKVVCEGWLSTYATAPHLYDKPSYYVGYCSGANQASNELLQRSDLIQVIYDDYCNRDYEKGTEYSGELAYQYHRLQFEEIILGSNHAFSLMDDDMREKVLEEVLVKNADIESGECYTAGLTSGFFAMVEEEYANGNSRWYTYICENDIEEAKAAINVDSPSWKLDK